MREVNTELRTIFPLSLLHYKANQCRPECRAWFESFAVALGIDVGRPSMLGLELVFSFTEHDMAGTGFKVISIKMLRL